MNLAKESDTPNADTTLVARYSFQQTRTGTALWLLLPSTEQQKESYTISPQRSQSDEVSGYNLSHNSGMYNFNSQDLSGKKKKMKKSSADGDVPDEGSVADEDQIIISHHSLSQDSELGSFNSENGSGKKKKKRKKGVESLADGDVPDAVHTLDKDGGDQIHEKTKKKHKFALWDNLSQDSKLDILKSYEVRVKKKKRKKKDDDCITGPDEISELSQVDRMTSSLSSGSKSDEVGGHDLSQDSEFDNFNSQDVRGRKKKKWKKDIDSSIDDIPDGVHSLNEDDGHQIREKSKKRHKVTLGDNLSQDSELGIFKTQKFKIKKKKKREKKNYVSLTDGYTTDEILDLTPPFLNSEVEMNTSGKKRRKNKVNCKSTSDGGAPDGVMEPSQDNLRLSSPNLESNYLCADGDSLTPIKSKRNFGSLTYEEFKLGAPVHADGNEVTLIPADNESLPEEKELRTPFSHKKKKCKSYSRNDNLKLDECNEEYDNCDLSDDSFESTLLQLRQRIKEREDENSKEDIEIIEELLEKKNFSLDDYSEVLDKIAENNAPSTDVIKRLNELSVVVDWNVHSTHQVESRVIRIPTENEMAQMQCLNENMKKGRYLPSEDRIIKKNWNKFSKVYGFENPEDFLIVRKNNCYLIQPAEYKNFVRYLGRGLPHRTLNSIYMRFRRLFEGKKPGRLSTEMKNILVKHVELYGKKYSGIKTLLNKSSHSLSGSAGYIASPLKAKSFKTLTDKTELFQAILSATDSKSYEDLQGKTIDWKKVGSIMNVRSESCRKYWTRYLSGFMALKEPVPKKDVLAKIFEGLKKMNVGCSSEVNWHQLSSNVFGLPSTFLWHAFSEECYRLGIKYSGDKWRGAIEKICALCNEKNRNMAKVSMYPCCKFKNSKIVYVN